MQSFEYVWLIRFSFFSKISSPDRFENFYIVASENGLKTQSSKVHPSPGAARRSVWALPLTASCNMVAEESNHTEEETSPTEEKDCNMLCCSDGTEMMISVEEIFDIVKNG